MDETEEWFALELENNSDPEEEEWRTFDAAHGVSNLIGWFRATLTSVLSHFFAIFKCHSLFRFLSFL